MAMAQNQWIEPKWAGSNEVRRADGRNFCSSMQIGLHGTI